MSFYQNHGRAGRIFRGAAYFVALVLLCAGVFVIRPQSTQPLQSFAAERTPEYISGIWGMQIEREGYYYVQVWGGDGGDGGNGPHTPANKGGTGGKAQEVSGLFYFYQGDMLTFVCGSAGNNGNTGVQGQTASLSGGGGGTGPSMGDINLAGGRGGASAGGTATNAGSGGGGGGASAVFVGSFSPDGLILVAGGGGGGGGGAFDGEGGAGGNSAELVPNPRVATMGFYSAASDANHHNSVTAASYPIVESAQGGSDDIDVAGSDNNTATAGWAGDARATNAAVVINTDFGAIGGNGGDSVKTGDRGKVEPGGEMLRSQTNGQDGQSATTSTYVTGSAGGGGGGGGYYPFGQMLGGGGAGGNANQQYGSYSTGGGGGAGGGSYIRGCEPALLELDITEYARQSGKSGSAIITYYGFATRVKLENSAPQNQGATAANIPNKILKNSENNGLYSHLADIVATNEEDDSQYITAWQNQQVPSLQEWMLPTKTGYNFEGYYNGTDCYIDFEGSGTRIFDLVGELSSDPLNESRLAYVVTLKAKFSEKGGYILQFDPSGGNIDGEQTEKIKTDISWTDTDLAAGIPVPAKDGHEFLGWWTEDGIQLDTTTAFADIAVSDDLQAVTVYARWRENGATIVFETYGKAATPDSISGIFGEFFPAEIPSAVVGLKQGLVFAGWSVVPNLCDATDHFDFDQYARQSVGMIFVGDRFSDVIADWQGTETVVLYAIYQLDVNEKTLLFGQELPFIAVEEAYQAGGEYGTQYIFEQEAVFPQEIEIKLVRRDWYHRPYGDTMYYLSTGNYPIEVADSGWYRVVSNYRFDDGTLAWYTTVTNSIILTISAIFVDFDVLGGTVTDETSDKFAAELVYLGDPLLPQIRLTANGITLTEHEFAVEPTLAEISSAGVYTYELSYPTGNYLGAPLLEITVIDGRSPEPEPDPLLLDFADFYGSRLLLDGRLWDGNPISTLGSDFSRLLPTVIDPPHGMIFAGWSLVRGDLDFLVDENTPLDCDTTLYALWRLDSGSLGDLVIEGSGVTMLNGEFSVVREYKEGAENTLRFVKNSNITALTFTYQFYFGGTLIGVFDSFVVSEFIDSGDYHIVIFANAIGLVGETSVSQNFGRVEISRKIITAFATAAEYQEGGVNVREMLTFSAKNGENVLLSDYDLSDEALTDVGFFDVVISLDSHSNYIFDSGLLAQLRLTVNGRARISFEDYAPATLFFDGENDEARASGDKFGSLPTLNNAPDGYVFLGWSLAREVKEQIVVSGDTMSNPNQGITLYAIWAKIQGENDNDNDNDNDGDGGLVVEVGKRTGIEWFILAGVCGFFIAVVIVVPSIWWIIRLRRS